MRSAPINSQALSRPSITPLYALSVYRVSGLDLGFERVCVIMCVRLCVSLFSYAAVSLHMFSAIYVPVLSHTSLQGVSVPPKSVHIFTYVRAFRGLVGACV